MNTKRLLVVPTLMVPALLLQGQSCQTTDWNAWHLPYANEQADPEASLIEYFVTVTPPNPPLTTEYTYTVDEVILEDKAMDPHYFEPYPGYQQYVSHHVKFGPHLPDRSALTYARYGFASEIRMVSDGLPPSTEPYVTSATDVPYSWSACDP